MWYRCKERERGREWTYVQFLSKAYGLLCPSTIYVVQVVLITHSRSLDTRVLFVSKAVGTYGKPKEVIQFKQPVVSLAVSDRILMTKIVRCVQISLQIPVYFWQRLYVVCKHRCKFIQLDSLEMSHSLPGWLSMGTWNGHLPCQTSFSKCNDYVYVAIIEYTKKKKKTECSNLIWSQHIRLAISDP